MLFLSEHPFALPCKISSLVTIVGLTTGLEMVKAEVAFASREASSLSAWRPRPHHLSCLVINRSARLWGTQLQSLYLCCFLNPRAGAPGTLDSQIC